MRHGVQSFPFAPLYFTRYTPLAGPSTVPVRLRPPDDRRSIRTDLWYVGQPREETRGRLREASPVPAPRLAMSVFPFHHAPWSGSPSLRSSGGVNAPAASSRLVRE